MKIAFLGSSLLSSYWNGAATYYRGIIRALARRGQHVTFYEPDAYGRQAHRDLAPPDWADVVVYPATRDAVEGVCRAARSADVIVKASGVGVFDDELLAGALGGGGGDDGKLRIFWDVDAPATLADISAGRESVLARLLPQIDAVFTYGGGEPVVSRYVALGARECWPIYNAVDPQTHHPVPPEDRFRADLAFLGNRLPDREARVNAFFFAVARAMPGQHFLLGGSGWEPRHLPANVRAIGHVATRDHNAFNVTPRAVINIARDSMAELGFSPATRVFEAAGAGACLITDAWDGIDGFLEPGREVLVARSGAEVASHLRELTPERARSIGEAARRRICDQHTYDIRAAEVMTHLALLRRNRRGVRP